MGTESDAPLDRSHLNDSTCVERWIVPDAHIQPPRGTIFGVGTVEGVHDGKRIVRWLAWIKKPYALREYRNRGGDKQVVVAALAAGQTVTLTDALAALENKTIRELMHNVELTTS